MAKSAQQNEALFRMVLNALPYPFYVIDAHDYSLILANTAAGIKTTQEVTCHEATHKNSFPCKGMDHPCTLDEICKTGNAVILEHLHYDAESNIRNVQVYGYPVFDDAGKVSSIIEATIDITDRRKAEEAVRESGRILKDFLDTANDLIQSVTPDGHFLFVNRAWKETLCYRDEDLPGITLFDIIHPDCRDHCNSLFQEVLKGKRLDNVEAVFVSRDGTQIPVEGNVNLRFENGRPAGTRGIFRNITERKSAEENLLRMNRLLEQQATTDPLTGLFNRMKFTDYLAKETEKSRRYGSALTLIMFDVDRFKTVNDTLGHPAGDRVLQEIAGLVSGNIRQFEVFARWGGDEFLILSPDIELEQAVKFAEKLRLLIEQHSFGCSARVTCSFGLTQLTDQDTAETFTGRTDKALYQSKQRGRNQVGFLS